MEQNASMGGDIVSGVSLTLHKYSIETYAQFAESYQGMAMTFLTLFIVAIGYMAIRGKVGESVQAFISTSAIVIIVFAIFLNVGVFIEWIYQPLMDMMFGMMNLTLSNNSELTQGNSFSWSGIYAPIDTAFSSIFNAVEKTSEQMKEGWNIGLKIQVGVVSFLLGAVYGALYVVFSVLIIMALFALHVLIVLGPIFGIFAAFKPTRGFFAAWLKAIITYALIPVFTAIVMAITLEFLNLAVNDITNINVDRDGVFTSAVGGALFIGIMSITMHMKAPELAAAITGAQVGGLGGFFGTVAATAAGGAAAYKGMGGGKLNDLAGGKLSAGAAGLKGYASAGASRAYSKLRGFVK